MKQAHEGPTKANKREIPPQLVRLLEYDRRVSEQFCRLINQRLSIGAWKSTFELLEFCCHGVPTVAILLATIYLINSASARHFLVNTLVAVLVDLCVVCLIKAYTRRRRPQHDASSAALTSLTVHTDTHYSFPSGHASRAVLLSCLLSWQLLPGHFVLVWVCSAWSMVVCASRVLLRRHYLLDVLSGAVLGYLEASFVVSCMWMSCENSAGFLRWLGFMPDGDDDDLGAVDLDL